MLCPWCMHCGASDEEYYFDRERHCGICAQRFPRRDEEWLQAFRQMEPAWFAYIEQELNRIGASKSGLDPHTRARLADAVDAFVALRLSGEERRGPLTEQEFAAWLRFACGYYAPGRL